MGELDGKVAIVTGASRGLGKGVATRFAREGAAVVVAARSEEAKSVPGTIHDTVARIQAEGGTALAARCDVTDAEQVGSMVQRTLDEFGRIDVLVNNAGGPYQYERIETYPMWRLEKALALNVTGVFICAQAVLPTMIAQKGGSIMNVSSGAAQTFRYPGDTVYGLTKAAVERFSLGLAYEVRGHNISVVAVQPGMVKTEGAEVVYPKEFDWTGWQDPLDAAKAFVWLAQQTAETFTMRVVRSPDFGTVWP